MGLLSGVPDKSRWPEAGGRVRQEAVPQAQGQGARGQARGKGHRPHPGTERGREGVPKPGPRSVPPSNEFPAPGWAGCGGSCRRVGRMWGWGQLKRSLTVVSPAPPSCPPIRPLQITCFQLGHRRTISSFPRKDIIDTADSSHQRLELCHTFL